MSKEDKAGAFWFIWALITLLCISLLVTGADELWLFVVFGLVVVGIVGWIIYMNRGDQ